ncbi:MAG: MFS transporter [Acidobacteria bacterium]|jgi:ACS family hexuronate transporter-like MFS transporter|nr:MFS transporter [Acidobacteriota bacterium]
MSKAPIKNLRWYIVVMLCSASTLNYLDRQTLSVLAQTIQRELGLSTVQYSYITTSFLVSYTVMYAVSGRLMDLLGTARGFTLFVSGWSIANMLHALARSVVQFSFFRFLLGATEPANFPGGVKAVSEWFPMKERALAVGIFNSGTAIGAALATPVVSAIALAWGWRPAFVITGALGFIWVAIWLVVYRLPQHHERITDAERDLILSGSSIAAEQGESVPIMRLLRMRETWGCVMARFLTDPISYFLFFWIPKYLQQERGFSLADLGKYAWMPYAALALGNIASGAIPRWLIARGWTLSRARKTTMLADSCLIPICCLLVTRVHSPAAALGLLMGMMFGHSLWGNITLPAEVFPKRAVGSVSGFGGAMGGLAGAVTQLTIGWVVQRFSFTPIFAACSGAYLLGFLLVHFLIGELGYIREMGPGAARNSR